VTWEQIVVAIWMIAMFLLQFIGAYVEYVTPRVAGTRRTALYMLMMAVGSWIIIAVLLHRGGFW